MAAYKSGVGLVLDAGGARSFRELVVTSPTQGWTAQVYVFDDGPDAVSDITDTDPVAEASDIQGNGTFDLGGAEGRVVVLWITRAGPEGTVTVQEATVEVDG